MQAHDIDAVRALFLRVYGYQRSQAEDIWRYTQTESGLATIMLAELDGVLVGAYAAWHTRMMCGGEMTQGAQAFDVMVDPLHHGRGLFTQMGEAIFRELETRNIKIFYGFPNPPSLVGHTRKMSWHLVTHVPQYIRPVHPLNHFPKLPTLLQQLVHRVMDVLQPRSSNKLQVLSEKPDSETLEGIIRTTPLPHYSCHILRDAKWFAWRYDDSNGLGYEWIYTQNGFAVFRVDKGFLRIAECWGDTQAVDALLRHIIRAAYAHDCVLVMLTTNITQMKKSLWRHLFFCAKEKLFIVRPLTTQSLPANIHTPKNWHIMHGDFDAA